MFLALARKGSNALNQNFLEVAVLDSDLEVSRRARLSAEDHAGADLRRARDPDLRREQGAGAEGAVVGDVDEVVEFDVGPDLGVVEDAAIDRRVGA